eukprot:TRINITY_DN24336_c0_g1_i2.p1 TRINITY_DN24336_c0_g1~~TRINITY_DN24336_c0_g1_i2.p1  ORF type:complete len:466 (-),score=86.39 TRINITY_DN24336_c0_g1_i2:120-1418(-)
MGGTCAKRRKRDPHEDDLGAGDSEGDTAALALALGGDRGEELASAAASKLRPPELRALRLLAEQACCAIDYRSVGLGWEHPTDRLSYREGVHPSFQKEASKRRSQESREALRAICAALAEGDASSDDGAAAAAAIVDRFAVEIGARRAASGATFAGVSAALAGELLLPLRALNEGGESLCTTFNGWSLPVDKTTAVVAAITSSVLDGTFRSWRYSNPVGQRQLEGLTEAQLDLWTEATATLHGALRVHEDEPNELGFFWATKIGGPSHGFDFEAQCLLPLLANARHKVILVSDPAYPYHPVGRAHFRLLWTHDAPQRAVLWVEAVNKDFRAQVDARPYLEIVLVHALRKAQLMGVSLSCDPALERGLAQLASERGFGGSVKISNDRLVLRPSNGVVEASDYLSPKHDWAQLTEEVTDPLPRAVYYPAGLSSL